MTSTFLQELEADAITAWDNFKGSAIAISIDNAYHAAITEIETLIPEVLETLVSVVGDAALAVFTGGGGFAAAFAAGEAALSPALESAGVTLTEGTVKSFVNGLVIPAQAAASAAPASDTTVGTAS